MVFTDTSRSGEPTGSAAAEHTGSGSAVTEPTGTEPAGTDPAGYRNIPVKLWYPASDTSGKKRANWIDNTEISSLFAKCKNIPDILGQLTLIKTNSYVNTELSEKEKKYPVILFSGGGAMFNGQNVIQMEELASHGYIVCAVGHPYDDFACEYPDGTILPYDPEHLKALGEDIRNTLEDAKKQYGEDGSNPEFIRYVLRSCTLNNADAVKWSEDMSLVADELTKLNSGEKPSNVERDIIDTMDMFAGRLDMEKLGIFGHSFGGAAAGEACLRDSRFKAFINMDGSPFGTAVDSLISQPFMILTTDKDEKKIIRSGYSDKQINFITVYINGAEHMNFSDFNAIIPNIGKLTGLLGKIDGNQQRVIMNDYILAFFNKHLKGMQTPILESSTPEYPEVMLESD
jgi:predicted dienelactone hydrolase